VKFWAAFFYQANASFNAVLRELVGQIKITFDPEDTMETASHFIHKDCLQA
jgi:hypothetical protein